MDGLSSNFQKIFSILPRFTATNMILPWTVTKGCQGQLLNLKIVLISPRWLDGFPSKFQGIFFMIPFEISNWLGCIFNVQGQYTALWPFTFRETSRIDILTLQHCQFRLSGAWLTFVGVLSPLWCSSENFSACYAMVYNFSWHFYYFNTIAAMKHTKHSPT